MESGQEDTSQREPNADWAKNHGVVKSYFFEPLWNLRMVTAGQSGEISSTDSETNESLDKDRPSPILLISEETLISFQTELKIIVTGEFFRKPAAGTRIATSHLPKPTAGDNE
jgi:hypothetical protein